MDSIFLLGDGDRAGFLQQMMQSFGCLHICLWSYLPHPSNCLLAMDGLYRELSNQQPSSLSGSLASRLFHVYRESANYANTGFSFKNNLPYMELNLHDLQRMASNEVQLQFYQEAGIKKLVFMGCAVGEVELGMSNDHPQVDLVKKMRNLFPVDFYRQAILSGDLPNHPPSSSSSSLRSLSVSPEYSPIFFNISPTTTTSLVNQNSLHVEPNIPIGDTILDETIRSIPPSTLIITTNSIPQLHHTPALTQIQNINNIHFLATEVEDAAITKAILVVSSSPSASSTRPPQNLSLPPNNYSRHNPSAFTRNLNNMRRRQLELHVRGNRPSTTQLHHMISERRRREKLNESFQFLRSLLPSGTKKDKASVLSSTTEYLSSLKSQVAELSKRTQILDSQLSVQRSSKGSRETDDDPTEGFSSVDRRKNVEITQVSSSTSEARFLDLRVRVRSSGESKSMLDLVVRILEFLKQQSNVSLSSVESNTRMLESVPVHEMMIRLKTEGDEFNESGFGEAVKRVVDDQPH